MVDAIKNVQGFFRRSVVLGSFYGIPLRVDYSWFLVFFFLLWLVAVYMPSTVPLTLLARLVLSLLTVTVFFLTLLAHEFAHAFTARREGIPVNEIHLHPFGGVASLKREPENPSSEFRIAISGPLVSLVIALIFGGLYSVSSSAGIPVLASLLFIVFLLNLFVAVFNMFPGFPLDGGRVLRSVLRKRGMQLTDATRLTANFGQIFGAVGIFSGLFLLVINRDWLVGLWSSMVGVYLFTIARRYVVEVDRIGELKASEVMELPVPVAPEMSIQDFVDKIVAFHRLTVFPVSKKRQLYGFVLLEDIKKRIPREGWAEVRVKEAMKTIRADHFVEADAPLTEIRELLKCNGIGMLGVLDSKGDFIGTIMKGRIRRRS